MNTLTKFCQSSIVFVLFLRLVLCNPDINALVSKKFKPVPYCCWCSLEHLSQSLNVDFL